MSKPTKNQYSYRKETLYTEQQKKTLKKLESLGVNINKFIRSAVREKIQRDWKQLTPKPKKNSYAIKALGGTVGVDYS
jgi:hypothetical protein